MNKLNRLSTLFAVAPLLLAPAMAHATVTNLLSNGSFETIGGGKTLAANTWHVYSALSGWTVDPTGGVEVRDNVAGAAEQGKNFIELDTDYNASAGAGFVKNSNSWISQTVSTKVGQKYTLSFYYAPREDTSAASNGIELDVNGKDVHTYSGDSSENAKTSNWKIVYDVDGKKVDSLTGKNESGNVWKDFTYTFVATSATSTIKFEAVGTQDTYGGSLDNVSLRAVGPVSPIPEPSTYALIALGLGMIAFYARRKGGLGQFGI